jgi:hypothetical protein
MPSSLEDFLKFVELGKPFEGRTPVADVTRPTLSGLNWLAVPSDCVGVAYRINDKSLEALSITEEGVKTTFMTPLFGQKTGVNIAASPDGRMVAVCTIDGSISCYDVTDSYLGLRWVIEGAHSHVVSDVSQTPSTSRDNAAGEAGPIRSFQFSPVGYALLMADDGQEGLTIYHAELTSHPKEIVKQKLSHIEVASATWSPATLKNGTVSSLAVGAADGTIHMYQYNVATSDLEEIMELPCPGDPDDLDGWSCTHLDWLGKGIALAAGFCRVIPAEEDDDGDEDDSAEHEASLFVVGMDADTLSPQSGTNLGDVVPFFSVPRNGRHVFFTSFVETNADIKLLLVASNVASEIGIVAKEGDGDWKIIEIPEGSNVIMPLSGDEFTFPTGLAVVRVATASGTNRPILLLSSTDGSLSRFDFVHEENASMFTTPGSPQTVLPYISVEETLDSSPPELTSEPDIDQNDGNAPLQASLSSSLPL